MPELGWVLACVAQGKGYATEALRAAVAWGDARFGPAPTVCLIDPDNLPSLRVAEKIGYREIKRAAYSGRPTVLFKRTPAKFPDFALDSRPAPATDIERRRF
jgi:RimJ/RimL family protein N-acetyltransferase